MLPYFVGGLGGVTAQPNIFWTAGYGYYHFSGAKQMVDGVRAVKDRYVETKAAVAEKREVACDKMSEAAVTAKEMALQKRTDLRERWAARRKNGKEEQDDKEQHEDQ
ncbi:hypothetical protein L226DRAFT_567971 [Lentinus tigrinus ALCF2SS1-7]|uniref:uncharacterized protein n=1 Tax=Lentinus tigrinus ALCF2SS1-7 TaxID=1328758 RepID=UPI001165DF2E|nr:hypothetical protein L226DRAFT_567971 [Lentinus tigrinus ALCF2SS1-7]